MALSFVRSRACRRLVDHSARRTSSRIIGDLSGERRTPLDSHGHPASKPAHRTWQMPLFSAPLSSSAHRNDGEDASAAVVRTSADGATNQRHEPCSEYERLVRKLYMVNLYNPVKLGLDNMEKLHQALGSPMDQPGVTVVHIAGSNGKGSVALKIADTLRRADYRVGLFVSPHVSSFRERVQVDGRPLSEARAATHLREIFALADARGIPATFFEVTTALAFRAFAADHCEVVVLETGLGGRLDATNVVRRPALSIVTSIGLEHTRILGDTREEITAEKAGIVKEGCPVLVGAGVPWEVLRRCAEERGASDVFRCGDVLPVADAPALEDYDAENSRIASAALVLLQFHLTQQKIDNGTGDVKLISSAEIEAGVKIRPPCRFEEMDVLTTFEAEDGSSAQKNVRVLLDVAHNPQAMDYLVNKLRSSYPNSVDTRMVVGMSADKDLKYCTDVLLDHVAGPEHLHLVAASHPRAAPISSMLAANARLEGSHHDDPRRDESYENGRHVSSVARQVRRALRLAAENDELLVVCGSVFIMADAREELGIAEPRDSAAIAAVAGAGMRNSQENFGDGKQ